MALGYVRLDGFLLGPQFVAQLVGVGLCFLGGVPIALIVRHALHLGVGVELLQPLDVGRVEHRVAVMHAVRVQRDCPKGFQRVGVGAVLAHRQVMRFVADNQIPFAGSQRIVLAHVGVRRDDDSIAGIIGIRQPGNIEAEQLSGLLPVLNDLVVRRHDKDVRLALIGQSLDGAKTGKGLAGASAIREQHPVAIGHGKACFRLGYVFLLAFRENRQRITNRGDAALVRHRLVGARLLGFVCD